MLTVITPSTEKRLTSPLRAAVALRTAPVEDLAFLVDAASAAVRVWCGRNFALETVRETFRTRDRNKFTTTRWPIVSIDTITVDDEDVDPDTIDVNMDAGLLQFERPVHRGAITYTAGYELPFDGDGGTLPSDIEYATIMLVRQWWHAAERDPMLRSDSVDGVASVAYQIAAFGDRSLSPEIEGLLLRYREVVAL